MIALLETLANRNGSWGLTILGGVLILFVAGLYSRASKSKYPLPPGPKGAQSLEIFDRCPQRDLMCNSRSGPKNTANSDVIYLNLLGQPVIILNSLKSAVDLLEKRGSNYNDRPAFALFEALGFKNNLSLMPDGAQFRKHRKVVGSYLSARSSLLYRDGQLKHAREMGDGIAKAPGDWLNQLSRCATRVIFDLAFGIDCTSENDPYFKLADRAGHIASSTGTTGLTVLDIMPSLEHLPRSIGKFIPSVKFVHDNAPIIEEFQQRPLDEVMSSVKAGTAKPSFISRLIEARDKRGADEEEAIKNFTNADLKGVSGLLYSAGQDSTFSTETIFVLAMVLTPEVQSQAQKEVDTVTGGKRLPDFGDWKALPIVERIVHEVFRFHPAAPNGIPHRSLKEDTYREMYIPKVKLYLCLDAALNLLANQFAGAVVIVNSWAMAHDPDVYKDPFKFNPDRYLPASEGGANEPIPTGHFGFGRRVCPGQYIGFASVWIVVATILARFNISNAKDKDGEDIIPAVEFSTGISRYGRKMPYSAAVFQAHQ